MSQGLANPGFRSVKVENWDFSKKDSQDFQNLGSNESLESLESKIRSCLFFLTFIIVKKQCGTRKNVFEKK